MTFAASNDPQFQVSPSEAIRMSLAPGGGLFAPMTYPRLDMTREPPATPADAATQLLGALFADDPVLGPETPALCAEAFAPPIRLCAPQAQGRPWMLELFHGPTGAFKDFGARFLAAALPKLDPDGQRTILVATSGDTGGAVGCAFERRPRTRVVILYPEGGVSPFQERQLTCWEENVFAFRVAGDFDACQSLAKAAFADGELKRQHGLASANSINLGRLAPQAGYFAWAAAQLYAQTGRPASVIVPTGNLGNALGCLWARAMGAPIGRVVLAVNANRTLADWSRTGAYEPRASVRTLANAMDVGAPNNFARLQALMAASGDNAGLIDAFSVSDLEIRGQIARTFQETGEILCPHTAVGMQAYWALPAEARDSPWIVAATAHAYKFRDIVEPTIGQDVPRPAAFEAIEMRPTRMTPLEPQLNALAAALENLPS